MAFIKVLLFSYGMLEVAGVYPVSAKSQSNMNCVPLLGRIDLQIQIEIRCPCHSLGLQLHSA